MFRKLINRLFNYNRKIIDLMRWSQNEENTLLKWRSRGIIGTCRDIKFKKWSWCLLAGLVTLAALFIAYAALMSDVGFMAKFFGILILILFFSPFFIISYLGITETRYYNYHMTKGDIELISWKEDMVFARYMTKIFLWILTGVCLFAFMIDPSALLVGFGGVTAVGAIAGAKLFSKDYIETHLDYEHILTKWETIEKIKIDTSRQLILIFGIDDCDKEQKINLYNLFCTNQNFNEIEALVKKYTANNNNLELIYGEAYTN